MVQTKCGFNSTPGGASGRDLLVLYGPTLGVNIGFDPNFQPQMIVQGIIPAAGIQNVNALVDSGATESCIDNLLAAQLKLPVINRREIAGVGGKHTTNVYLAQIHVLSLKFTIYGAFAGVNLLAGGQSHYALVGRTFLQNFTMVYEGRTGTVILSND